LSTGTRNTFIGAGPGYSTTGTYNTFVGTISAAGGACGEAVTTGTKNTIIGGYNGNQSGLDIRTASNKIVLSDGDGNPNIVVGAVPNGPGAYALTSSYITFGLGGTAANNEGAVGLNGTSGTNYGACLQFYKNGTFCGSIGTYSYVISGTSNFIAVSNGAGGVYLNGASATSWTAVSDETRKVIIEPITDAVNKVSTLRAVIGRLKTDDETVRRPYLIAQDVQAVLPEAVSEAEDKEGIVLGLSYTEVIPLLVAAIKELKAELDTAKAQISALQGASA